MKFKYIQLIILIFSVNNISFSQNDTAVFNTNISIDFKDYNNDNFKWEPYGRVIFVDSNTIYCSIETNVTSQIFWYTDDSIKFVFLNNLKDTTRDFATFIILASFFEVECCNVIEKYCCKKNKQKLWRTSEKEYWLKYWERRFLHITQDNSD